jgi:hypothetical protein
MSHNKAKLEFSLDDLIPQTAGMASQFDHKQCSPQAREKSLSLSPASRDKSTYIYFDSASTQWNSLAVN